MAKRLILHSDANCFYASVEMQRDPKLRNKPMAVCGSQEERHGIVLTASYPAKRRGVKTGMAIWQAKQGCPELIVVPPNYHEYSRISRYLRDIYEDYTDQVEPFGLDECWLDISGSVGLFGDPMKIAQEISERVKYELGITVSIGVSFNKITAKLGSDYKKPDAITRIMPDNYKEIVYPLPVEDLLYVGPATAKKLRNVGISTIGRLAMASEEFLQFRLGKMGVLLSIFANGRDTTPVVKADHIQAIKSIGNSSTCPRDLVNDTDVRVMLFLLAESVAARLREISSKCTTVEISVRDSELMYFTRQQKIEVPTCSSGDIAETAFQIFKKNYRWQRPIRSIGVRGANLVDMDVPIQYSAFYDLEKMAKLEALDQAVDDIRYQYGYHAIRRGIVLLDPLLSGINPKDDHTIHPIAYRAG